MQTHDPATNAHMHSPTIHHASLNRNSLLQLHMRKGSRGPFDERVPYPDAPLFSPGGRTFLQALSRATHRRLQITLGIRASDEGYFGAMRFRAPDAGRMLWAMGKLQWKRSALMRLLEQAVVRDISCEWNRPRYMTTALWGSAWSSPGTPLVALCGAIQSQPEGFWAGAQSPLFPLWTIVGKRPGVHFGDVWGEDWCC